MANSTATATPHLPRLSMFDRLRNWSRTLTASRPKPIKPPVKVGDRVLDVYGKETTVIHINPKSNNNGRKLTVRYDDGRGISFLLMASGLQPLYPLQNPK
jgi:hypothetical protein